jgi:hypothetical protein
MRFMMSIFPVLLFTAFIAHGDIARWNFQDTVSALSISGSVGMSMGEVMKGKYRAMKGNGDEDIKVPATVYHAWFGQPQARCNLDFAPSEKLKVQAGFEANVFVNTFPANLKTNQSSNGGQPILPSLMDWRLHQAQGIFSLIEKDGTSVHLSLGYIPYKYNPEVRNLGEFLFRSGTYPFFLINGFDFPAARLSGLRANFSYVTGRVHFTFDQFILTERNIPPLNDVSFASVASVDYMKIITIGAGVDFSHAISVNSRLTSPDDAKYVTETGDTGSYTFQGVKFMGRATLDPFVALRGKESLVNEILGKNGGKIYAEAAVIGLANYPASLETIDGTDPMNPWGYGSIAQRTPLMAGINIPFWKILDVCALEFEHYPSPNPNSAISVIKDGYPLPFYAFNNEEEGYDTGSGNAYVPRWYWSVYLKKQIVKNFSVVAQVGRDHIRWEMPLIYQTSNYDYEDAMVKPDEWGWHIKTIFNF